MRALRLVLTFVVLWSCAPSAWAQLYYTPPATHRFTTSAPTTTTWDPSNKGTNATLSNGNLTVTNSNTTTFALTRTIANHGSGKYYAEVDPTSGFGGTANALGMGVGDSSAGLNNYCGNDGDCYGMYDTGQIYHSGSNIATYTGFAANTIVGIAIDVGGKLVWFTVDGTHWNAGGTADPCTGVGGLSISGLSGNYYIYGATIKRNSTNAVETANFGATSYSYGHAPGCSFGNM